DTRAPAGRTGTWLLDPHNVTVNGAGAALTDVDEFSDTPAADLALDVTLINTANSNVFVRANNDGEFLSDVDIVNPGIGLTVQAGRSVSFDDTLIRTNNGNITIIANERSDIPNGVVAGNRDNGPAIIDMNGDVRIDAGTADVFI